MTVTKKFLLPMLSVMILLAACQTDKSKGEAETKSFDWISGDWKRVNEEPGKETYEYWLKRSDKLYTGKAFTLQAGDTTFSENLKILRKKDGWYIDIIGSDGITVPFQIMSVRETGLSAENPDYEFPKYIKYRLRDGRLEASIADDNNEIEFIYKRMR